MCKCKLAPVHGHTIPRLELCAAFLAAEIGETVVDTLQVNFKVIKFYTDNRVVLGYLKNSTRLFYNYFINRVQKILFLTKASQWSYVHTKSNPADVGSRGCTTPEQLASWLHGPDVLQKVCEDTGCDYPLISPDGDKEVRREVRINKITVSRCISEKFEYFSSWQRLLIAFMLLKRAVRTFKTKKLAGNMESEVSIKHSMKHTEQFIFKVVQKKHFTEEIKCLESSKPVSRASPISKLNPYLDEVGIVRVGGRLNQSPFPRELTNPIVLSKKDHTSVLLIRHFHEIGGHEGRHIIEGSLRIGGFWIIDAKRLISSILHSCVTCRKLRGEAAHQIMADLPVDRLTPGPPISNVGVDVFGPREVVSHRTRGDTANSKRWAALFTCLTTQAVHTEVLEEMTSSSFINALRRFIALRGNVKELRSDRGTNFVGAMEDLKFNVINVEGRPVAKYLKDSCVTWKFNAPHSSRMGGVWERMIGIARMISDGLLLKTNMKSLTHELLVTLMAEVVAIMNSRPIAPISNDPENPVILTPATLLNQKTCGDLTVCFDLNLRDLYKSQWKMVQVLSDLFWKQWRESYLHTLQTRRKWRTEQSCVKNGDIFIRQMST